MTHNPQFKVKIDPVANDHPIYFLSKAARIWLEYAENHGIDTTMNQFGIFIGPALGELIKPLLPHDEKFPRWNKGLTVFGMPVMIEATLDNDFVYVVPGELV